MYDWSHRKHMVDTLRPVERTLCEEGTVKVQARARGIKYRRAIGLDHNLGKCQM